MRDIPQLDLPPADWTLPDDACWLLAQLVKRYRPELVVEAGSGRSTVILAASLGARGCGSVVSLEHNPGFHTATLALVDRCGRRTRERADVRLAPLEPHGVPGLLAAEWYTRSAWEDLEGIDLLVVDGPPGRTSPFARGPALQLLRDRMAPGAVVMLDDVNRDAERKIWDEWGIEGTFVKHAKATLAYGTLDGA